MPPSSVNAVAASTPSVAEVSSSRELEIAHDRERHMKRRLDAVEARLAEAERKLAVQLAEQLAERVELIAERDEATARIRELEDLLAEHQDRIDVLLTSRSWRVTEPLRRLKRTTTR